MDDDEQITYEEFVNGMVRKMKSSDEVTLSLENSLESMWKRNDELHKMM